MSVGGGCWYSGSGLRHRIGETVGEGAQGLVGALFSEEAKEQRAHVWEGRAGLPAGHLLGQAAAREHVHEHIGLAQLQGRGRLGQRQANVEPHVEKPAPEQAVREVIEAIESKEGKWPQAGNAAHAFREDGFW